ncbi:3-dehydroquinate synthase family protein [Sphingomonas sp. GCM10030256]|uniref:3-dehydroquinate synthase n=1 Tax=Sphingomonas sp. GCM10030256 TaxID=3273427 RepID=UPI00360B54AF
MQSLFEIRAASGSHPVSLSGRPVREVVDASDGTIVLADAFFRDQLEGLARPVVFIEATEEAKDFAAVAPVIEECRRLGLARNGHILAVGGGVVQDIACFIATVYMRGVKWTFLPTTLLAMVDSCIGGKSSINVGAFKNLAGSFFPPNAIVVPVAAVETLPAEHVAAGKCEAAKICFARSDEVFSDYLAQATESGDVGAMVSLSLGAKKWFVEVDEFDQNERLLLNFGHSFGHALESCTDYLVTHGVAVGVGCLAAVEMSAARNPAIRQKPRVAALINDLHATLSSLDGLPSALRTVRRADFFRYWQSDKKHNPQAYRPILLDDDGYLYRAELARDEAADDAIWGGFEAARDQLANRARIAA